MTLLHNILKWYWGEFEENQQSFLMWACVGDSNIGWPCVLYVHDILKANDHVFIVILSDGHYCLHATVDRNNTKEAQHMIHDLINREWIYIGLKLHFMNLAFTPLNKTYEANNINTIKSNHPIIEFWKMKGLKLPYNGMVIARNWCKLGFSKVVPKLPIYRIHQTGEKTMFLDLVVVAKYPEYWWGQAS